jgi:hypothetical protein
MLTNNRGDNYEKGFRGLFIANRSSGARRKYFNKDPKCLKKVELT